MIIIRQMILKIHITLRLRKNLMFIKHATLFKYYSQRRILS